MQGGHQEFRNSPTGTKLRFRGLGTPGPISSAPTTPPCPFPTRSGPGPVWCFRCHPLFDLFPTVFRFLAFSRQRERFRRCRSSLELEPNRNRTDGRLLTRTFGVGLSAICCISGSLGRASEHRGHMFRLFLVGIMTDRLSNGCRNGSDRRKIYGMAEYDRFSDMT